MLSCLPTAFSCELLAVSSIAYSYASLITPIYSIWSFFLDNLARVVAVTSSMACNFMGSSSFWGFSSLDSYRLASAFLTASKGILSLSPPTAGTYSAESRGSITTTWSIRKCIPKMSWQETSRTQKLMSLKHISTKVGSATPMVLAPVENFWLQC